MAKMGMRIHSPMGRNALGSTRYGTVGVSKALAPMQIGSKGGLGNVGTPGSVYKGGSMRGGFGGGPRGK